MSWEYHVSINFFSKNNLTKYRTKRKPLFFFSVSALEEEKGRKDSRQSCKK
jgi:hypothetical protein